MYWGSNDCSGGYDMWTAVDVKSDDCNNLDCTKNENMTDFSIEGFCDN